MRGLRALWASESGASAAEFVVVVPLVIVLIFGSINFGLMMYSSATLHYAVEDAARCAVVKTTVCNSTGAIQTYAAGRYKGPDVNPTFTPAAGTNCYSVTASGSYTFTTGLVNFPVTINASACYPLQPA